MFCKIVKNWHFLFLCFCCFLAEMQTKKDLKLLVNFSGKEEAKKFFDEKICAEIITPFVNGIKREEGKKDVCKLLRSNIYQKMNILTMGIAKLPTDSMFQNLYKYAENEVEKKCNFDLHRFRLLLELYKKFAKKEWISEEDGFENVFELANGHVLKWFNGTTEQRDPETFESFFERLERDEIIVLNIKGEGKEKKPIAIIQKPENEVKTAETEKEEKRRGKRPMEGGEEDKVDRKKKVRRETEVMDIEESEYSDSAGLNPSEPLILELNWEEAFEVKEHIFSIVDTFWKDMKDGRANPLEVLRQEKHFDNFKIFMHLSGSPKVDEFMDKIKKRLIKDGINPSVSSGIEINMPDLINVALDEYKNPSREVKKRLRNDGNAKKTLKGNIFKQYMQRNVAKNVSWPQKEKDNLYKIIEHFLEGIMNGKYREYEQQQKSFYFIGESKLCKLSDLLFPSAQKQNFDLYLFWFMLFIGKQIIFNPEIGIDLWEKYLREKYFIQQTIESVEKWATNVYDGSWPTYSSLSKLFQIKIVKHQIPSHPIKEGDEREANKGKGKMDSLMESGEKEKGENPFVLELNREEAFEMEKNIENIAEVFWKDIVKDRWENLLELFKQEKHYDNFQKFFHKSWSQKVDEFMEKVKKNRNIIKLAITGHFVSDLYKFWFMLFIGKQIMCEAKKTIIWECSKYNIDKTIESIERYATKKYGSWPTYSSLAELIQIKIVYPNALPQRPTGV